MNDINEISGLMRRLNIETGARNIDELAADFGLTVNHANWFSVTAGEFSWASRTITVNGRAKLSAKRIIAHEIGHFLVKHYELNVGDEEGSFAEWVLVMHDK